MIKELIEQRKVSFKTSWSEVAELVKDDARYMDLLGQHYPYVPSNSLTKFHPSAQIPLVYGGSTPQEIFEDLIASEKQQIKDLKPLLKEFIKDNGVKFQDTSFAQFDLTLTKFKKYQDLSDFEKRLLHEYYQDKVK